MDCAFDINIIKPLKLNTSPQKYGHVINKQAIKAKMLIQILKVIEIQSPKRSKICYILYL